MIFGQRQLKEDGFFQQMVLEQLIDSHMQKKET